MMERLNRKNVGVTTMSKMGNELGGISKLGGLLVVDGETLAEVVDRVLGGKTKKVLRQSNEKSKGENNLLWREWKAFIETV